MSCSVAGPVVTRSGIGTNIRSPGATSQVFLQRGTPRRGPPLFRSWRMFSPIARVNDMHICLMQTPAVVPIPHVGGPVVGPGALTVWAGGMPVSVMGDIAICVGPPDIL